MKNQVRQTIVGMKVLSDLVIVVCAWFLSFYLRFHMGVFDIEKGIPSFAQYLKLVPFIICIWGCTFYYMGHYARFRISRSAVFEGFEIIRSSIVASLIFVVFTYFYDEFRYSRGVLIFFVCLSILGIAIGRSIIRKINRFQFRNRTPRKTLIIGSGSCFEKALSITDQIGAESPLNTEVALLGSPADVQHALEIAQKKSMVILEHPKIWKEFIVRHNYESIIIALPHSHYQNTCELLNEVSDQIYDVRVVFDLFQMTKHDPKIDIANGIPYFSFHESPLVGFSCILKRFMDIFGALVALTIFAPIMLICAALVKLSSPGSIFYKQSRMGLDGKVFDMLKFRSMPEGVESKTGAVWAQNDDNRPTNVGRIMRKLSFDELPQLFNVLKGEMSLVGPRPERPVFVQKFRHDIPGYMLRHKVKAGITGWAQINGWRGNTSLEKRIQCDLYYVQNWSIGLDLKILILTFFRGFFHPNAY